MSKSAVVNLADMSILTSDGPLMPGEQPTTPAAIEKILLIEDLTDNVGAGDIKITLKYAKDGETVPLRSASANVSDNTVTVILGGLG